VAYHHVEHRGSVDQVTEKKEPKTSLEQLRLCGANPLSAGDTGPVTSRGRVVKSHVTPQRGVAWDAPLARVSREREAHTRNDPSGGVRGDEHLIGSHERA